MEKENQLIKKIKELINKDSLCKNLVFNNLIDLNITYIEKYAQKMDLGSYLILSRFNQFNDDEIEILFNCIDGNKRDEFNKSLFYYVLKDTYNNFSQKTISYILKNIKLTDDEDLLDFIHGNRINKKINDNNTEIIENKSLLRSLSEQNTDIFLQKHNFSKNTPLTIFLIFLYNENFNNLQVSIKNKINLFNDCHINVEDFINESIMQPSKIIYKQQFDKFLEDKKIYEEKEFINLEISKLINKDQKNEAVKKI